MKRLKITIAISVVMLASAAMFNSWVFAGDLDDDIANVSDDPIAADDNLGSKATNINFIVAAAVGKAKNKAGKNSGAGEAGQNKSISNFDDGTGDTNENSVVVEAGSRVDKVYNIIIEK